MKNIFELECAQEPTGNNIMIVDALNLAFRWKHSGAKTFADSYIDTVKSLARSYASSKVIIACDYGKSSYRLAIYPEYKGDREKIREKQTEEERDAFIDFITEFNNTIEQCKEHFLVLKYKGVEADDIAAFISHELINKYKDKYNHVWLISSDKDWDHLIDKDVSRWSYITRKEYTINNWSDHYAYPIDKAIDIKAITGGKDNVKGIDGIGEKRALKLIEEYDNIFDLYDSLPISGKSKYIQNLNENKEVLLRNMLLIDKLTYAHDAIGKENIQDINTQLEAYL